MVESTMYNGHLVDSGSLKKELAEASRKLIEFIEIGNIPQAKTLSALIDNGLQFWIDYFD